MTKTTTPQKLQARWRKIHRKYGKALTEYRRLMDAAQEVRNAAWKRFSADLAELQAECPHKDVRHGGGSAQCMACREWME